MQSLHAAGYAIIRREPDEATVAKAMVAADFDAKGPLWSEFGRRYLREEFVATMWPVVLPHARAAIRAVVGE